VRRFIALRLNVRNFVSRFTAMRSFRDNSRFIFFYDVLGISFASIYREFCVVLSSFVFDVTSVT
jgi:hypothetical protein